MPSRFCPSPDVAKTYLRLSRLVAFTAGSSASPRPLREKLSAVSQHEPSGFLGRRGVVLSSSIKSRPLPTDRTCPSRNEAATGAPRTGPEHAASFCCPTGARQLAPGQGTKSAPRGLLAPADRRAWDGAYGACREGSAPGHTTRSRAANSVHLFAAMPLLRLCNGLAKSRLLADPFSHNIDIL